MLACRELLSRLPDLKLATVGENKLPEKDCIKRFDEYYNARLRVENVKIWSIASPNGIFGYGLRRFLA